MKLTKKQLKRIIKEELEAVMNESEFDYISHLEHLAVRNPELKYMADELRGDPADRRYNWDLIQHALKMLGPVDDGKLDVALTVDERGTVSKLRDVGMGDLLPEKFAQDIEAVYTTVAGQGHGVKIG